MAKRANDPEVYASWRKTIPFSDDAIVAALEQDAADMEANGQAWYARRLRFHADMVRRGRLTKYALRYALPNLITVCAICGKTALYRWGSEGRCRAHKNDRPDFIQRRHAVSEAKLAARARVEHEQWVKGRKDQNLAHWRRTRHR